VNALFAAAVDLQKFCIGHGWRSAVIGGLAVQRWGEPRQTRAVDLTLLTGLGGEERFVDPLLAQYRPRIADARAFAIARRVVLVETAAGIPLDIALGGLPFEARVIERSTLFEVEPDVTLTTCSAEDLVAVYQALPMTRRRCRSRHNPPDRVIDSPCDAALGWGVSA
jgi:hypothetical protein